MVCKEKRKWNQIPGLMRSQHWNTYVYIQSFPYIVRAFPRSNFAPYRLVTRYKQWYWKTLNQAICVDATGIALLFLDKCICAATLKRFSSTHWNSCVRLRVILTSVHATRKKHNQLWPNFKNALASWSTQPPFTCRLGFRPFHPEN